MTKKIQSQKKNNDPTIDGDSSEINEKTISEEKYKADIEMRRNRDFSVNIFLYSYPIPLRCTKNTIYLGNLILEKKI